MGCTIQPDSPPWQECICYCVPCWLDHGDGDDDDDTDDTLMAGNEPSSPQLQMTNESDIMSTVGLSPRPGDADYSLTDGDYDDATFTLPDEYDAMQEYENHFGEFDPVSGDKREKSAHLRPEAHFFQDAVQRLEEGTAEAPPRSLFADLNMYVIKIRSLDRCTPERHELIDEYERLHYKYRQSHVFENDKLVAQLALEYTENRYTLKKVKLENYRKAIFFTHPLTEKGLVREKYRAYCESLKRKK